MVDFEHVNVSWVCITFFFFFKKERINFVRNNRGQFRSNPPEVFLRKDVLKMCSKCTGEHPRRSVIYKATSRFDMGVQNTFLKEHLWRSASDSYLYKDKENSCSRKLLIITKFIMLCKFGCEQQINSLILISLVV